MADGSEMHDQCQRTVDRAASAIQAVSRAANPNRPVMLVVDDLRAAQIMLAEADTALAAALKAAHAILPNEG